MHASSFGHSSQFPPLEERLRWTLLEDWGTGDVTTDALGHLPHNRAVVIGRAPGVISGVSLAGVLCRVAEELLGGHIDVVNYMADGDTIAPGQAVMELKGPLGHLLRIERALLNLMQRVSGVATLTRRCVEIAGGQVQIVDTRKTTPLWRDIEKAAVLHGGGTNHRFNLATAYMVKNNHVDALGGMTDAIHAIREHNTHQLEVTIEVRDLAELDEALLHSRPTDYILLDNFRGESLATALGRCRGRVMTELSGGVTVENLAEFVGLGLNRISMGALTHSAPALDLSLRIRNQ